MKFIINGDKLKIEQAETINSGSFEDYLMPVEFDESWDNLNIEAIIAQDKSEQGVSRAVVNNQVYIDMSKKKRYTIGFIGYTVENNQKVHQKTTDLKIIPMLKGAGEIEATNTEEVPTESEWEVYLAQVQEFINNGNEIINQANNLDLDITTDGETSTIIITRKDGTEKRAVVSGAVEGDLDHSKFQNLDYEHAGHIGFQATINDLNTIREGANAGATAVQPKDLGSLATKNIIDYDTDIANKPIIPEEVTESTISSWGFTKNTGTYSKPNGGIPKTDLTSSVQASLEKADSALQSHQDISIKEDKINKSDNFKTSSSITYASTKALVDGLETKQNKLTAGNNITIENDVISATGGSSGGTSNYNDLSNKPKINNVELSGNKSLSDLGIATKTSELTNDSEFVSDSNYTHTDNNYTTTEKDKLASLSKIDSQNKLNSDLVDDTSTTNKFTSTSEKNSWNAKYDKPSGGIPSTDMSSGVQASLRKADTAIQDVSDKEDKSNKVTTLSSDSTDTQYPSAKVVYDELEDIKTVLDENDIKETEKWLKGWFAITTNNHHHGYEYYPFSTSNTTTVERLYDSVGLSITPATDTVVQVDNLPEQFKSFSCNFFVDNEGVKHITAIKGMSNNYGETEATIKNVVYKGITYKQDLGRVRRTRFYNFGLNSNSKFEYDFYWTPKDGYVPTPMAINKDGSISPFYVIASCVAGLDSDGQLRSLKGLRPAHYLNGTTTGTEDISTNICYSDCISLFHNRNQYYSAGLMSEYMDILLDFYLKFGTRDTQSIMKGNTLNNYQYAVSYGESNVNRVVLTTSQANNIDLLSCVSVGDRGTSTSTDRNSKILHNIVNDARVIGKEAIDETYTALILDHASFTTTETTFVSTIHEVSGFSDFVLGDYGSPISNSNGKHGFVFDGIEIAVGGYEVAGNAIMNIADSTGKRDIYITNDVSELSSTWSTIQSNYNKSDLSIQPTTLNAWNYITKMEADLTNGLFVPTECGQSGSGSSVGFADGCYIDNGTSGQREFLWLGRLDSGASAGLLCVHMAYGITNANWNILARLSINGVGGELAE